MLLILILQLLLLLLLSIVDVAWTATRLFHIQAEVVKWSYTDDPDNDNARQRPLTTRQREQTLRDATRLGSTFDKALYVQYTDDTFTTRVVRRPADEVSHLHCSLKTDFFSWVQHLGLLGPLLRCSEADTVVVVFRNALPFNASVHIDGLFQKHDDASSAAPPNGVKRYEWKVRDRRTLADVRIPTGASSRLFLYRSDVTPFGADAGLVGALLVMQEENLQLTSSRNISAFELPPRGIDAEFVLLLQQVDEDLSPLAQRNYAKYATVLPSAGAPVVWQNRKFAINGRSFGALPRLVAAPNARVRLHVAALSSDLSVFGLEIDQYAPGNTLALTAGETGALDLVARPGRFVVSSPHGEHALLGMSAVLEVAGTAAPVVLPPFAANRTFFLRATDIAWFNASLCVYRAFSDATFATMLEHDAHAGVVGPLLHLRVGDGVEIVFENNCSSVPGVGLYLPALLRHATSDDDALPVAVGARVTLRYTVPRTMFTDTTEAFTFLYRPPSPLQRASTLVGLYTVLRAAEGLETLVSANASSALLYGSFREPPPFKALPLHRGAALSVAAHAVVGTVDIDGVPTLNGFPVGEPAVSELLFEPRSVLRLHMFAYSAEATSIVIDDVWQPPSRGAFISNGNARSVDIRMPFAGVRRMYNAYTEATSSLWWATKPGATVQRDATSRVAARRVFLRAETRQWNFAPKGRDAVHAAADCAGAACWPVSRSGAAPANASGALATWVQYADNTFTRALPRPAGFEHMGALGPLIRMIDNERLEVHLRNTLAEPVSLRLENCLERLSGVTSDPAPVDARTDQMTVAAGGELVLHFVVAASMQEAFAREGTTSSRSCVYRNPLAAPASRDQLLGMLVITRTSTERSIEDPVPRGVDREFVLVVATTDDMSHINGFVAGNGADLFRTTEFARVRWYTATVGAGRVETVWWFGTSFTTLQNVIVDSLGLLAHATRTLDTIPDHKGTWLVRSAADTQFSAGAFTAYTVDEAEPSTQAQLSQGQWRTIDGSFNMRFHRSFGAAGNPFQRSQALTNPALPLPAPAAVADSVFFALPTLASLRRPLVSRLLNAFTGFVVADMADVTPNVAQAPVCADASAGASNCTVRLYPTSAFARVERDAASVRATFERAIGLAGFDAAAIEREPLPAVINAQTSWIDLSTIYGVTTAVNRRARTLRDGRLSTSIADWPLSSAPIEQLVLADLFVREHNRHAGALARLNASRSDDELFRLARELTIAAAQLVAAKEWLPTLTGDELPDYVASSDAVDNDNELLSGTAFRQVVLTSSDGHKADLRGDSSLTFALACAPALRLSVASESLTLRDDDLEPLFDVELGHLSASQCSGSALQAARCFEFGVEPILRGLFADGAPAIGPRVIGTLASLRAGDAAVRRATPQIDAATEWLIRGREALLPSFADLLRQSGRAVPATFAALVGLAPLSNVTAELARAQAALARGDAFDWRPLVARQLERAYPLGVEQLDALVGLLVEPPALPLSSSLGPTLASCVTQQVQRTRAADRLWFQNDVVNVTDLLPSRTGASLLRELITRNYNFSDAAGAPAAYPFYALRTSYSSAFALFGNAPDPVGNRTWQNTTQPLPSLRFSWVADEANVHVLLETPSESYVALGFGPRAPGTAMKGGDFVMLALRDNGAVVVRDSFGLFDQQEPYEDESVNGTADWFDVRAERSGGVSRYWLSRARRTGDKFDNAVPADGAVETMFALGTVPLRGGAESDVLATYHGQQRATSMVSWPVRVVTAAPTSAPPSSLPLADDDDSAPQIAALIGGLLAATAVLLLAVVLVAWFLVRRRRLASAAAVRLQELDAIVDGERVPVPDSVRECELHDANFPLAVMNPSTGLFRDPVLLGDYDEATLKARREAQQNQQVPVRGVRLLAVDRAYADILSVMNVSDSAQDVTIYLPACAAQYKLRVDPARFRLGARQTQAVKVTVALNCTTKQKFALRVGTARFVAALPVARVESELSTALDYDEIQLIDRIGEGSFGVVFSGSWRKQPVAVKLLRQQQFAAHELSDLRAEAKFLSQLLHRNVVQFRGAVFRESQCCLVTELAPHGSLKVVVNSFSLPWDLVIKMAVDVTCGLQFLHLSGIIHRDVKSDNVLVFSLSPREAVCAKLTDFGSARAAKAHIDATGKVQLGADRNHSQADGTPIYMSPQLLAKTSRPSEASDCYALGCLFYEIASEREPWADLAFSWDVAKAVMAGKRPEWPQATLTLAPSAFVPLVTRMWSQLAEARPQLEDVLQELAACQEAIGDRDAAAATLANVRQGTGQTMDKGIALALATQSTQSRSYGSSGDVLRSGTQRTASTIGSTDSHDTPAAHSDSGSNTSSLTKDSKLDYAMSMRLVPKVAPPRNTASVTSGSSGAGSTAGDSTSLASLAAKNVTGGVQSKNRTIGSAVVSGKNVTGGATNKNRTVGDNERQAFPAKNVTGGVVTKTRTLAAAELDAALAANEKSVATPTPTENKKTKKAKAVTIAEAHVVVETAETTKTAKKAKKQP